MLKESGLFVFFGGEMVSTGAGFFLSYQKNSLSYIPKRRSGIDGNPVSRVAKAGGKWLQWREERKRKVQGLETNGKAQQGYGFCCRPGCFL